MQAIVIAHNQEEREFFSYTLRHVGLAVARTSEIKLVSSSLLANPVDLIFFAPSGDVSLLDEVAKIRSTRGSFTRVWSHRNAARVGS